MSDDNDSLKYLPPQELEAEQQVLGACLLEPGIIGSAYVRADDFYGTANGKIFSAMRAMIERGEDVDLVTLAATLGNTKALEAVGGASYLSRLISETPTAANFRSHERLVISAAQRRAAIRACIEAEQQARDQKDADAVLSVCIEKLNNIRRHEGDEIMSCSDLTTQGFQEVERRYEMAQAGKIPGIPTGFRELDKKLLGIQPQFYLIAGASGMGKTALATQFIYNAAVHFLREWKETPQEKRPPRPDSVGLVSLEMGPKQVALRLISMVSGIPLSRLMAGTMHDTDWPRLTAGAGVLHPLPIHFAFSAFNDRQISRVDDDMVQRLGAKLIAHDYLQLERCEGHEGTREQEVTKISQMHKRKTVQYGVPHIVISSLNRGLVNRADKRPVAADLRDSGNLEYDADVIMLVYRDEVYNCKCPKDRECLCGRRGKAEIIIDKGRMEGTGTVELVWHKSTTSFRDVAEGS